MSDTCILISTCKRYRPVAEWTASRIAREWENHPPLRYAGLHDTRDWMAVNLDAVDKVLKEGFRWLYLVLDDHPPVGPCNGSALNNELPRLAAELEAVNIGLLGWGQRREREGTVLGETYAKLLRNEASFRWKFSLHPSLWHADSLRELLEIRSAQFPVSERTPWNFERHRDGAQGPVGKRLLENTYRVHGGAMSTNGALGAEAARQTGLLCYDIYRFALRILRGQRARNEFDRKNLWLYCYYRGPYPILWSGAMRQGVPSGDFENFLRFTRRTELRRGWDKVKKQIDQPRPC
ncbi:MAG: hypothetical protein JHC85_00920 [Chthoniobacterales bacterium]|nr:hypothetical protein [Chthoniobacterales bacterium]